MTTVALQLQSLLSLIKTMLVKPLAISHRLGLHGSLPPHLMRLCDQVICLQAELAARLWHALNFALVTCLEVLRSCLCFASSGQACLKAHSLPCPPSASGNDIA